MNARIAFPAPSFERPRPVLRPSPAVQTQPARRTGWLERLAEWAERQPVHRRMGSWERLG